MPHHRTNELPRGWIERGIALCLLLPLILSLILLCLLRCPLLCWYFLIIYIFIYFLPFPLPPLTTFPLALLLELEGRNYKEIKRFGERRSLCQESAYFTAAILFEHTVCAIPVEDRHPKQGQNLQSNYKKFFIFILKIIHPFSISFKLSFLRKLNQKKKLTMFCIHLY